MRRSRLKVRRDDWGESRTPWMLTFSDLCTLLMTFFVLILSMSSLNKKAFQSTFGHLERPQSIASGQRHSTVSPRDAAISEVSDGIQKSGSMKVLGSLDSPSAERTESGQDSPDSGRRAVLLEKDDAGDRFSFVLSEDLLFGNEGSTINPETAFILEAMGSFLRESSYCATVNARTTSSVGQGGIPSTAQRSAARGYAVLSFLIDTCKVSPDRLSLGSNGVARPVADGKAAPGGAMNQRIEIVFEKTS